MANTDQQNTIADKAVRSLLWLLIGLPVLAVLGIVLVTGVNDERVLKKQARQLLLNRTSESAQYANAFLKNVQTQVKMSNNMFSEGLLNKEDLQQLENYYIVQLELQPVVAGLYTSNMQGDFFYVSRSVDKEKGKYRVKLITRSSDTVTTQVWYRNPEDNRKHNFSSLPDDGYDSRQRPWFIDATNKRTTIWTNPYVFFTTKQLGVTIASPYFAAEKVAGAIGIDVELTELAEFLQELDETRFGSSFIVAENGTFIADSEMTDDSLSLNEAPALRSIGQTSNTLIKKAYASVLSGERGSFAVGDQEYLVEATSLKLEQSTPWYIVSYANKNDFLKEISANNRRNYWIAGIATLLSILLGKYFASLLSRPVHDLEDMANRDQLTGLYNRRYLNTKISYLMDQSDQQQSALSFAILDVDHFKRINDTYGHDFGDDVLKIFAKRFTHQLREKDILVRLGGEEFLLIFPGVDAEQAKKILDVRRESIKERPFKAGDKQAIVTFSAGVVEKNDMLDSFESIYKAADEALYKAKQNGRDQVVIA